MPGLLITATLAQDDSFRSRVMAGLVFKARHVIATMVAGGTAPGQEFSRAYAVAIVKNPLSYAPAAAWVLATDPAIAAVDTVEAVTDEMIGTAINATWPALAGMSV